MGGLKRPDRRRVADANLDQQIIEKVTKKYHATDVVIDDDGKVTGLASFAHMLCEEGVRWTVDGLEENVTDRCPCQHENKNSSLKWYILFGVVIGMIFGGCLMLWIFK